MSLGQKIQQLRKAGGFSQEQLADTLHVSRQAVSKWETDQSSPDIENILAISRTFSISTDELLGNDIVGNSENPAPQAKELQRRSFLSLFTIHRVKKLFGFIDRKLIFMTFSLLCFIALATCVIVDYAINQQITWAAYPIVSILFGWVICIPLFFKKCTFSLCIATIATFPFLYLMDQITPAPDWFCKLGLPCAIAGIVLCWLVYLLFRLMKINLWYKFALSFFLGGVIVSPIVNYFVDTFLETEPSILQLSINIFSCLTVSAVFWALGYVKKKMKAGDNKPA